MRAKPLQEPFIIQAASRIRVLVAQSSDRPIARAGLCRLLADCAPLLVVGDAGTEEAALRLIAEVEPDVIVLDTFECDEVALDLLIKLVEAHSAGRLVLLTACSSTAAQGLAISHGALGIVREDQQPDVLLKAIKCVHAGEIWIERSLAANVLQGKSRATRPIVDDAQARIQTLTDRENEVISLVCEGLKNQAIAERLFISEAAVRHRLTSIFEKLRISDRLELVIFAYRHGLAELSR
jgi:DNA-binding NarL/FixJ family response regulator